MSKPKRNNMRTFQIYFMVRPRDFSLDCKKTKISALIYELKQNIIC